MEEQKLAQIVLSAIMDVAPEIEVQEVENDTDLRNELDFDSIDYLNFIIKLNEELGVKIPETDYRNLATPAKALEYLSKVIVT